MAKPVKNSTKQNTNSQRLINLKIEFMMNKQFNIPFTINKYYMNKKLMKNKNFQKIIWHH